MLAQNIPQAREELRAKIKAEVLRNACTKSCRAQPVESSVGRRACALGPSHSNLEARTPLQHRGKTGTTPAFASAPLSNALSSNRNLQLAHFSASAEAQSTPISRSVVRARAVHATTIKHSVAIVLDRVATRRTERRTGSDCPVLVLEADTFLDLSIDRATQRPPVRIRATVLPACGLRTAAVACLAVFANKALDFLHTLVVAVQCHNASERKRLVKQLVNWARANAIAMRTVWLPDPRF
jgi:hypothetical protein